MVSSRRVRKRSQSSKLNLLLPTYVALLEPLHLTLQSARDSKRPLFVLQVQRRNSNLEPNSSQQNLTSSNSWSFPRPFEDFEGLRRRLVLALQHGHFCSASCPWLYSFLTSEFPKKHIFQRNSSPRTVEARREKLLELLVSTLEFLLDRKNHACIIAKTDVAKIFAEFLYGEHAIAQVIAETLSSSEASSNSSRRRSLSVLSGEENQTSQDGSYNGELEGLAVCGVCNGPLACEVMRDKTGTSPVNPGGRRRSSVFATALQCGHQFHDECIVPVLNETLRCPTCHLEIK